MKYVYICLAVLNLVAFLAMGIDKYKAKKGYWRTQEKTFFILAALGGSIGVLLGMKCFRHKTLHWQFRYAMPLILLLQLVLIVAYYYRYYWGI